MKQCNRLISAVLAVIMAVSIILPFNAMPVLADDGTTVTLVNTASSNASSFPLSSIGDQYSDVIDVLEEGLLNFEDEIIIYSHRVPVEAMESIIKYLEYYRLCFFLDPYSSGSEHAVLFYRLNEIHHVFIIFDIKRMIREKIYTAYRDVENKMVFFGHLFHFSSERINHCP